VGPEELREIASTLESGWLTLGPKTEAFEKAMAAYLGAPETLAVSSCTAALHLVLRALEIGPGDAVITTPLTFVSTAHAILYVGAYPLFVDIDSQLGNLSAAKVSAFLDKSARPGPDGRYVHRDSGKIIKAILPVHYGGFPLDSTAFRELALQRRLHILEDAAHALGAQRGNAKVGGQELLAPLGEGLHALSAFSFYATKNLTTAEGGLLAGSPEILQKTRVLSSYGISDSRRVWSRRHDPLGPPPPAWDYDVEALGFKNNFTDIQASMGLIQLKNFPLAQAKRERLAAIYERAFQSLGDLAILPQKEEDTIPSWHLYPLRLVPEKLALSRDALKEKLLDLNIGTSVMFRPVHTFSFYRDFLKIPLGTYPEAERFFETTLSLPLSPKHSESQIEEASHKIRALLLYYAR
jgi:dTDP-4-amino-4,6-dideoxygalactose transaminase